jgi:hypothetical protein
MEMSVRGVWKMVMALKVWSVRFVRFNLIGTGVFCLATLVYARAKFNKNSRTIVFESAKNQ